MAADSVRLWSALPPVFTAQDHRTRWKKFSEVTRSLFWDHGPLSYVRDWAVKEIVLQATGKIARNGFGEGNAYADYMYGDTHSQEIKVRTADGVTLQAFQKTRDGVQKWIVFFNGNAECFEQNDRNLSTLHRETGANILAFNYRGVGRSEGRAKSAQDLVFDGEAMVQYLLSQGVAPDNILIYGRSLGGGVGAQVAALHPGVHFCSERSFSTLSQAGAEMVNGVAQWILQGWKGYLLAPVVYPLAFVVRKVVIAAAKLSGWEMDSVKAWKKINGQKFIIFHHDDGVIRYKASLYRGVKRSQMSLRDWLLKIGRKCHPSFRERSAFEYKPVHIRLRRDGDSRAVQIDHHNNALADYGVSEACHARLSAALSIGQSSRAV